MRTSHAGQGRCWLHGGATPITHGTYSGIKRTRIRDLIELYEPHAKECSCGQCPDRLNLHSDLASARAIFHDFVERYDQWMEAFLAWHASFVGQRSRYEKAVDNFRHAARTRDITKMMAVLEEMHDLEACAPETPKPRQVLDIAAARHTLLVIARIVEVIERINGTVTRPELLRILTTIGLAVESRLQKITQRLCAAVTDAEAKAAIVQIVEEERRGIESDWRGIPWA